MSNQDVAVGMVVVFTDENRVDRPALVTAVWGDAPTKPCINIVFVSGDESRQDSCGRQIERHTSLVHAKDQTGGGMCWRLKAESKPTTAQKLST